MTSRLGGFSVTIQQDKFGPGTAPSVLITSLGVCTDLDYFCAKKHRKEIIITVCFVG